MKIVARPKADRMVSGNRWYDVDVKVRFPEQKGTSIITVSAHAANLAAACHTAIRQVLATHTLEACISASTH